jgi:hypothetical protein
MTNCTNVTGDELRDCKNTHLVFNSYDTENLKFAFRCPHTKDSMDVTHGGILELAYEHAFGGSDYSQNIKFIINGAPALIDIEYSDLCQSSSNLFGCIGLRKKQYCIFNKQYTKEEYEALIPKIKKYMDEMPYIDKKGSVYKYGEFFPFELSPFGYNETVANDLFPLSKEEILKRGYVWKDKTENYYAITKKAENLPDNIKDVNDSILDEVIECKNSKKAFKITNFELQFYRRMNIPLPRLHQDERHKNRLKLRNPLKLWQRSCVCDKENHDHERNCQNEFETTYAPERPEKVYCESCYKKEVY